MLQHFDMCPEQMSAKLSSSLLGIYNFTSITGYPGGGAGGMGRGEGGMGREGRGIERGKGGGVEGGVGRGGAERGRGKRGEGGILFTHTNVSYDVHTVH